MRTSFLAFSPPLIGDAEIDEVVDTLRSSWITTGPKVKRFEAAFAAGVGQPEALAVSSCTDALQIALAALGVGPGDAVFTPTMTFCATAHVAEHLGATPILVDSVADTLNIDPVALRAAVERVLEDGALRPRVVIPVHHSGHPCAMDEIFDIAGEFGLAVVEDAAHAFPAAYRGRPIGTVVEGNVPHAVAFSFYATKNLTTGEGGMLTASPDLLAESRLWSLHGMSKDAWNRYDKGGSWRYEVIRPGFKCNMTDIQAAIGLRQLDRLDEMQQRRRELVTHYCEGLADLPLDLPISRPEVDHAWHLFVIRLQTDMLRIDRGEFITQLAERNIGSSVHFIPLHLHPFYRDKYHLRDEDFPVATAEFERMISLPLNPTMSDLDAQDVIDAVRAIVAENTL